MSRSNRRNHHRHRYHCTEARRRQCHRNSRGNFRCHHRRHRFHTMLRPGQNRYCVGLARLRRCDNYHCPNPSPRRYRPGKYSYKSSRSKHHPRKSRTHNQCHCHTLHHRSSNRYRYYSRCSNKPLLANCSLHYSRNSQGNRLFDKHKVHNHPAWEQHMPHPDRSKHLLNRH